MNTTLSLALIAIVGLIILLTYLLMDLVAEFCKFLKARYRGEVYIFHFQSPLKILKLKYAVIVLQWRKCFNQLHLTIQALKDIKWLVRNICDSSTQNKYAFIAYSVLLFLAGAILSDLWDYTIKIEWIQLLKELINKAFQ